MAVKHVVTRGYGLGGTRYIPTRGYLQAPAASGDGVGLLLLLGVGRVLWWFLWPTTP